MHSFGYATTSGGSSYVIWGLTAAILIKVAQLACDRAPEFQEDVQPPLGLSLSRMAYNGRSVYQLPGSWMEDAQGLKPDGGGAAMMGSDSGGDQGPRSTTAAMPTSLSNTPSAGGAPL
jgi:hypothetical protein